MQVIAPQDSRLYSVAIRMGGGFGRGGNTSARGIRWGEWVAVASWEPALNQLCRLLPLSRFHLEVGGLPGPTSTDWDLKEGKGRVIPPDHLGKVGLDPVKEVLVRGGVLCQGEDAHKELRGDLGDVRPRPQLVQHSN